MPTQTLIPITTITFPEIALRTRDAHKLRGYFGELFREHSPLLHNHLEADEQHEGAVKFRYAYPLVQYKVLDRVPTLVGVGEGAGLLTQLFLQMRAPPRFPRPGSAARAFRTPPVRAMTSPR